MMKKLLFLGLAFSASVGVSNAQKARLAPSTLGPKVSLAAQLQGDAYFGNGSGATKPTSGNQKVNVRGTLGTKIGKTYYDLPSNAAVANRIIRHNDGSISAVWTETCTGNQSPSFASRGIGYNYFRFMNTWTEGATGNPLEFNGTCGTPQAQFGIASKRVGWPEIVSVGGNEMVFTHAEGISVTQRPTKGSGGMSAWSTTTDLAFTKNIFGTTGNNGTWPRVVSSGNNIHMIYCINNTPVPVIDGVSGIMVYSRSTDGGVTWDKQNIKLPGLSDANGYTRMGGDGYAIAANGNNVAIVAGYFGQPWTMWKSTDNGNNWTRTVMKALVPADTTGLGLANGEPIAFTNDNGHAVVIDNAGNAHAFAGELLIQVRDTIIGGQSTIWPGSSYYPNNGRALYHWTDKTPTAAPTVIAEVEPRNATSGRPNWVASGASGGTTNGRQPYGVLGMVSMPNAAVDANNNVYVVYTGVVRGTSHLSGDSTGQPYRDMYVTRYTASNSTWQAMPINIGRELSKYSDKSSPAENGEENVFPSVHHTVGADGLVHVTWMSDFLPGMNLGADADPEDENSIMYLALNPTNVRATGVKKDIAAFVNEIVAFPNPTSGKMAINVDLKKAADVKVRVTNVMGQEVATVNAGKLASGKNTVSVDMSNFANGIYLYTVSSEEFTVTNRIVKQ